MGYLNVDSIGAFGLNAGFAKVQAKNKSNVSVSLFDFKNKNVNVNVVDEPIKGKKEEYRIDDNNYDVFEFYDNGIIKSHEECRLDYGITTSNTQNSFDDGYYVKSKYEFDKAGNPIRQIVYNFKDPFQIEQIDNYIYENGQLSRVQVVDASGEILEEFDATDYYREMVEKGIPEKNEPLQTLRQNNIK